MKMTITDRNGRESLVFSKPEVERKADPALLAKGRARREAEEWRELRQAEKDFDLEELWLE